ncbi:MAG: molecular chaperone HtpG [Gemmataceae bacterium]
MSETHEFKTELKDLLHLIIHSLYSHKEIFLRELISNASDAIDTVRFQSLTNSELLEEDAEWKIKLVPDEENSTLTISDNGVGMNAENIVTNLGTIAKSGTKQFVQALQEVSDQQRPELIGQFGVGFYSAFMIADKVTVVSRMAGPTSEGVKWESDGQGSYTLEKVEKDKRGTDVVLHVKEEDKEFLQSFKLRQIVKQYSDFIEHPIVMDVEREEDGEKKVEEETLNSRKAIWLRPKNDIKDEEYNEFYRHIAHDYTDPLKIIHYNAEGVIEFKALLYVPSQKPFDLTFGDSNKGLHLYIQRVFIMDDCETLLPPYLRFMRGVVDSPNLDLNVSREILQHSAPLEKIKTNLTKKILSTLDEMRRKEYEEKYLKFYNELGVILKEGVSQDYTNREKIADLLLFESTKTERGQYTTLATYLENLQPDQDAIYYLAGETREIVENSPALESFKAKNIEVLLLTDPYDAIVMQSLRQYKEKELKAADKGDIEETEIPKETTEKFQPLLDYLKETVGQLKEVRLSKRLKESAVCLVSDENDMGAHMEHLMTRMGRAHEVPKSQRIMEVNAEHSTIQAIQEIFDRDKSDSRLEPYAKLLYDQAVIAEGSKVMDPAGFAKRINDILTRDAVQTG